MTKGVTGFIKGMGAGIATAACIGVVGSMAMKNKKGFKKTAGKAIKAVGDLVDNVQYMIK